MIACSLAARTGPTQSVRDAKYEEHVQKYANTTIAQRQVLRENNHGSKVFSISQ
jgi:hypothetical protein